MIINIKIEREQAMSHNLYYHEGGELHLNLLDLTHIDANEAPSVWAKHAL